jgi:signal recognition particle GTPase
MGCFGSKTAPAQMGETNIALIGVSGQGKTTYCRELAQIFTFDVCGVASLMFHY